MAITESNYFSNSIVGVPELGGEIELTKVDSIPQNPIGKKLETQDGRVYRYCHFGAVSSANQVVSTDVSESSLAYATTALQTGSSVYQLPSESNGVYPSGKGSRWVLIACSISAAAGTYDGGYLTIAGGLGRGFTYRIKNSGANKNIIYAGATCAMVKLYDPLQVSVDSTSAIIITGCRYANLEPASTADSDFAGVALANQDTAARWGWVQTKGIANVLSEATSVHILDDDNTLITGMIAVISTATAGSVNVMPEVSTASNGDFGSVDTLPIGYFVAVNTDGVTSLVNLTLD